MQEKLSEDRPHQSFGKPKTGSMDLVSDIWLHVRPYAVRLLADFIVSALAWLLLALFKILADWIQVEGFAGELIEDMHAAGYVMAFAILIGLFLRDIITISRTRKD